MRAERGDELVFVVGGRVRVIARVPHAEGPLGQHVRRAGQRAQVPQGLLVVVAVAEEVAVLVRGAVVVRPRRGPSVARAQRGVRVVEQRPATPVQNPGMQLDLVDVGARLVGVGIQAAGPAAQLSRLADRRGRGRGRVGPARLGDRHAVGVDVAAVAGRALRAQRVRARVQLHRAAGRGPRVPARRGRQRDLADDGAVDLYAQRPVLGSAVGVAHLHVIAARCGHARDRPGVGRADLPVVGGEPAPGVAGVVVVDALAAAETAILGLAGGREAARPGRCGPRRMRGDRRVPGGQRDRRVAGRERARTFPVAQQQLAGADLPPAVHDVGRVPRRREVPADHVECGRVRELAVACVLEADQGWRQHLEPGVAIEDDAR